MAKTMNFFKNKVFIIENFIDEPQFDYKSNSSSCIKFIFVGSLSKRKAILELIDAIKEIFDDGYSLELNIFGNGPEKENIINKINYYKLNDFVSLHGEVDNIFDHFIYSDVFILPSYSEGTSRAAMEALYAGLPCIMREVDSNYELINTSDQGILCNSKTDFKNAIKAYIMNPVLKKSCLLKVPYRQEIGVKKYLNIIEGMD